MPILRECHASSRADGFTSASATENKSKAGAFGQLRSRNPNNKQRNVDWMATALRTSNNNGGVEHDIQDVNNVNGDTPYRKGSDNSRARQGRARGEI